MDTKSQLCAEFSKLVKAFVFKILALALFVILMIIVTAYFQSGVGTIILLATMIGIILMAYVWVRGLSASLPCPTCERSLFHHLQQPKNNGASGTKIWIPNRDVQYCPYCGANLTDPLG